MGLIPSNPKLLNIYLLINMYNVTGILVSLTHRIIIMFGPFSPNISSFEWISTLLLFYVEGYFTLRFYPIDFKPWHNNP